MRQTVASRRTAFWDNPLTRYGIAVVATGMAVLLRHALSPILGNGNLFITFYPAVMFAAIVGGLGPGILATLLSAIAVDYWLIPPAGLFPISSVGDALSLGLFTFMGVFMSGVAGLYHRARQRVAEYEKISALRESQQRYRELVDNANSAIVRWSRDGAITFFNEYAQQFFGYSQEEAIGKSVSILLPEAESDGTDLTALVDAIVSNPEMHAANVNENVLRDGSRVWMSWTNRPILDENGEVVEILAVGSDITEQKRAERETRELEIHKREFYRRTILAATEGKLTMCEPEEIEKLAGTLLGAWEIKTVDDVGKVRSEATSLAREAGMDESRVYDVTGCVVESAANAAKHAGGGRAALYRQADSLLFVVSDSGPGIGAMRLPDVALTKGYTTAGTLGMGYKVMISFADRVYLATGPHGTTVATELKLHPGPKEPRGVPSYLSAWQV